MKRAIPISRNTQKRDLADGEFHVAIKKQIINTMKTNIRTLGLLVVLVAASVFSPKQASAQQDYVSLQVFYDELSPYGEWIDYPEYGYVWIPDEGSDFMPYSSQGQWVLTNYGWTWISDYEWGWAPFHYGRWDYDNYYGWLWVPDYEWGPSWVTWRSARGYYGWQPMRPGISISLSFGNDYYNNYNDYWMFVSDRDFQRPNVSRYYVNETNLNIIIRNSTVINNTYIDNSRNTTYVSGPAREDVQRNTGRRVSSVAIRENSTPGQVLKNGQLQIYRPNVRKNNDSGHKPTPTRITSREDVKRPAERNAVNRQRDASPTNNRREQQQQRQNTINQQNIDKGNAQREQQHKVNQSENNRQRQEQQQQQRQNEINQQNIDKGNAQREQQQKVNQSENNRQRQQQRQNDINQQNIDKGNAQREQQQKVNQSENNRQQQQQQQNIDKNNAQPAQQQKINAPQNNVREQRQINRQEKNDRDKQEKENKKRQE